MNQLEQDIINSANVKLAGIAKGMLFSALGGATSGGLAGAGLGSLLGGTIGAVKNYRNSAGTFGNRLKAGLTGGLKGGAKGGLIGGGVGAGLGSAHALLMDELYTRDDVIGALSQIGNMRQNGFANINGLSGTSKKLISYLEGLNSNGDNYKPTKDLLGLVLGTTGIDNPAADGFYYYSGPELNTLQRDALVKARKLNYMEHPLVNFVAGGISLLGLPCHLLHPNTTIEKWRMKL